MVVGRHGNQFMNYFILNNNFHLSHLKKYFSHLIKDSILLINKHSFDHESLKNLESFKTIIFANPIQTYYDFYKIKSFYNVYNYIIKDISFISNHDTLYVLSEQDFLNLKIVNLFFKNKAKIILLEDGTFTPLFLSINKNIILLKYFHIFLLNHLFYIYVKKSLKLINIKMNYVYNMPVYSNSDHIFSNAIITNEYLLGRDIYSLEIIKFETNKLICQNFDNGIVVFANSPHQADIGDKYFKILNNALMNFILTHECKKIIFCFHPRDCIKTKMKIQKELITVKNIYFEHNLSTKDVVISNQPEFLISFMSTSLLEFREYTKNIIFLLKDYPNVTFPIIANKMIDYLRVIEN
jgi:hypothetical protein